MMVVERKGVLEQQRGSRVPYKGTHKGTVGH